MGLGVLWALGWVVVCIPACVRWRERDRAGFSFAGRLGSVKPCFFPSLFGFLLPLKIYPKIQSLNVDFVVEPIFLIMSTSLTGCCLMLFAVK